jgi:hypothetical protein
MLTIGFETNPLLGGQQSAPLGASITQCHFFNPLRPDNVGEAERSVIEAPD